METKRCDKCGHVWGAYEDNCHCAEGRCHNAETCQKQCEHVWRPDTPYCLKCKIPARGVKLKTFKLRRIVDVSGVSGTGVVAEGVMFHDGQVGLSWFGQYHSLEIHPSAEQVVKVHGHGGKTVLEWDEDPLESAERRMRMVRKYVRRASAILERREHGKH